MPSAPLIEIRDLSASIEADGEQKPILKGVNLRMERGESHAIMGPNGSGKSTLSYVLLGHPNYQVDSGDILLDGESILNWSTDERARRGLFLSFQYPTAIPGVSVHSFLRTSLKYMQSQTNQDSNKDKPEKPSRMSEMPIREFRKKLQAAMQSLEIPNHFAGRYVNEGFSGGEKKRHEILQMSLFQPRLAILDEIDSGLDIDALRLIAKRIESQRDESRSLLLITHYQRLLNYLSIDYVHVFMNGRIIKSGGKELATELEQHGYEQQVEAQAIPKT